VVAAHGSEDGAVVQAHAVTLKLCLLGQTLHEKRQNKTKQSGGLVYAELY
jgi:hypothetical protein